MCWIIQNINHDETISIFWNLNIIVVASYGVKKKFLCFMFIEIIFATHLRLDNELLYIEQQFDFQRHCEPPMYLHTMIWSMLHLHELMIFS